MQTVPFSTLPANNQGPANAVNSVSPITPKTYTPTVVTSAPAAAAVQSAQTKIAAATTPPPNIQPNNPTPTPSGPGNPNVNNGNPTFPVGSKVDTGSGPVTVAGGSGAPGGGLPPSPGMPANPTVGQSAVSTQDGKTYQWNGQSWLPQASSDGSSGSGTSTGSSGSGSGTTIPGTQIPSTGNPTMDALIGKAQASSDEFSNEMATLKTQLDGLRANMDQANQALMDQIGASFDSQVQAAQSVNAAQVAGMTQSGIRSGLSMYAPEIYQGNIAKIMNAGIAKVTDILSKKSQALAKAQAANAKEDYTSLYQEMQTYEKMQTQEQTQTLNLLKEVQSNQKLVDQENKDALAAQKTKQTMDDTEAKDHAYAVLSALDDQAGVKGESTLEQDKAMVQEYASLYGLDAQKLLAQVEQLKGTKDSYGSGTIGQYKFYADFESQQGRTPMSFDEWQTQLAGAKAEAEAAGRKKGGDTTPPGNNLATTVSGIGLPLSVYTSTGDLSKSALNKVVTAGVPVDIANGIWKNISAGNDLNTIRQGLSGQYGQDTGFGYLDKFMGAFGK